MAVATIALTTTIRKAMDIASSAALAEGSLLCWLKEDIDWIVREMKNIQSYLKDADAKQQDGTHGVTNFILNIRDLANDVEDTLDTFLPRMESHKRKKGFLGCLRTTTCLFCYCYTANFFSFEIRKIRKRVDDINRARTTYGITDSGTTENREKKEKDSAGTAVEIDPLDLRRPILHLDEPNLVGFDNRIGVLKAKLLNLVSEGESIKFDQPSTSNPNVGRFGQGDAEIVLQDPLPTIGYDVISIVGMPGLGKTTLAKEVYKIAVAHNVSVDDVQLKYFNCSALVYVSQEPNINQILQDIASQVGLEVEKRKENLEANLYSFLSGKRYIIMLDDIWQMETWDALKKSIPVNSNGSKLIITSRNSGVGRYIGRESSLHDLEPLEPDDSWKLFSKMVMDIPQHTDETSIRQKLESVGRKIVERCGGVPLAIVVIAGLLLSRVRTEHAWTEVLESMGQHQEDKCSKILALSYKELESNLKPCFLYFGIFPEDSEISAFKLINLWVAEKLVQASGNRLIEDVGEDYLNEMVSRNLIQVVRRRFDRRIRSCRIHDLLHALCIALAKESNFFCTCSNLTSDFATRLRRVTTHHTSIGEYISMDHQTPKLRSFLCFNKDGTSKPEQLNFLCKDFKFLCVLSLSLWCEQDQFSVPDEIGNLIHMRYFLLRGLVKMELPATIRNLRNLLTMDLHGCHILRLPTTIFEIKQLKHILLPLFVSFYTPLSRRCCSEVEVSLPNLQTFIGYDFGFSANWLKNCQSLRTLKIVPRFENVPFLYQIITVLSDATPISHKLENLRIKFLDRSEMIREFNLSGYQNLCKLHIHGCMKKLPAPMTFPPNLTKLIFTDTHLDEDSMETLEKLPELIHLKFDVNSYVKERMVCSGAKKFCRLEVLQIRELHKLEELIVDQRGMPRLNKLIIAFCPNLKTLSPRLENIMTYECK